MKRTYRNLHPLTLPSIGFAGGLWFGIFLNLALIYKDKKVCPPMTIDRGTGCKSTEQISLAPIAGGYFSDNETLYCVTDHTNPPEEHCFLLDGREVNTAFEECFIGMNNGDIKIARCPIDKRKK